MFFTFPIYVYFNRLKIKDYENKCKEILKVAGCAFPVTSNWQPETLPD